MPPDPTITPTSGVDPQRWLESVPSEAPSSSVNSSNDRSEDSTKEQIVKEEDMKFLQSIKAQRGKEPVIVTTQASVNE
jgi:hypothetical protein